MALTVGTQLGSHEITALLGKGGMGEVYRARDLKLKREVAIKILPHEFADNADRVSRFQREAEVLASLNHPNIAAIHDLEETNGTRYLVLELVEGATLADRIARGPIASEDALEIAKQICEALEAAHERGIIHRDLKPANIKLTPDGKVKVLDFGLAKAISGANAPDGADLSNSPTLLSAATNAGLILGTAAYMSPEQAKGRSVDQRTDIFAFGCVLYEMLTGHPVFEGHDVTEILAAVIRAEPDWDRLPESTPDGVRALLRKCLRKDRAMRLQSAGDARIEVQEALSPSGPKPADRRAGAPGLSRRTAILAAAVALLLGGMIASVAVWKLKPLPAGSVARVALALPQGERLPPLNSPVIALSPDGSRIAYISARSSGQQIYVRPFDSTQATALPGTDGADNLTFSPDGKWLAFTKRGELMKVALAGGAPLMICKASNVRGLTWGDSDTIIFADIYGTAGLSKVQAGGGKPQNFSSAAKASDSAVEAHRWPQMLPGGNAVLFTAWSRNLDDAKIFVQRLDSNEPREVLRGGTYARYVPTGHLVYVRAGVLMAVRFDLSTLKAIGDPVPLAEGALLTSEGAAQFDVSTNGSFVHVPGGLQGSGRQLVLADRSGKEELLPAPPRAYRDPRLSPDGRQVAVAVQGANDDIWIYDISHQTLSPFTSGARSLNPTWTVDGARIIYRSSRNGFLNLFARAADGSAGEERLTTSEGNQTPFGISPDGQFLGFVANGDIWILPLSGDKKARPFLQTPFGEGQGAFSPDGHWLAYSSDESGQSEIYVQPFPDGGRRVQISRDGGIQPRWSSSNELFYLNGARLIAVAMTAKPTLSAGEPQVLFEKQGSTPGIGYDVTSDGKRFLLIKEPEQAPVTHIDVVLNWLEELKRAVPAH